MLDINLLRTDRGGDIELVRESERRRFADPTLVDKVIALDAVWREGASQKAVCGDGGQKRLAHAAPVRYRLDSLGREFNVINKAVGAKKKARPQRRWSRS